MKPRQQRVRWLTDVRGWVLLTALLLVVGCTSTSVDSLHVAGAESEAPTPTRPPPSREELVAYNEMQVRVGKLLQAGLFGPAEDLCRESIEQLPQHPVGYFNLACVLARKGKPDEALQNLAASASRGFADVRQVRRDPDLESLRRDSRYAEALALVEENATKPYTRLPVQTGREMPGIRTVEREVTDGLRYRLRMSPRANKSKPNRLIVWFHPAGGYANSQVEDMAPQMIERGFALLVFTQKPTASWASVDMERAWRSVQAVGEIEGIDADQPILMGFSAGGQAALYLWSGGQVELGGLVLCAAYPVINPSQTGGKIVPLHPPANEITRKAPIFAVVGGADGGSAIWQQLHGPYLQAGIPLTLKIVPQRKHEWLFDEARREALFTWLEQVGAGESAADDIE